MSARLSILDLLVPGEPAEHSREAPEPLLEEALERGNAEHVEIIGPRMLARCPRHAAALRALEWAAQQQRCDLPQFLQAEK